MSITGNYNEAAGNKTDTLADNEIIGFYNSSDLSQDGDLNELELFHVDSDGNASIGDLPLETLQTAKAALIAKIENGENVTMTHPVDLTVGILLGEEGQATLLKLLDREIIEAESKLVSDAGVANENHEAPVAPAVKAFVGGPGGM